MEHSISPITVSGYEAIRGNYLARRAIEIAAAGGHHVLLIGAPCDQREILARALCDVLPPMTPVQERETVWLYSMAGAEAPSGRPFRATGPTCGLRSLFGGGSDIKPGDVSLAHNGVLFFDNYDLAPKSLYEALRAPFEDGQVILSRYPDKKRTYLSRFQMVAAVYPCPCGRHYELGSCQCTTGQRAAYLSHMSSPVMDRIAVQTVVLCPAEDIGHEPADPVEVVRKRVASARQRQAERFQGTGITTNDEMTCRNVDAYCHLDEKVVTILDRMIAMDQLSVRSYSSILKIARTIADLDGEDDISPVHLTEAVSYRFLDKRH